MTTRFGANKDPIDERDYQIKSYLKPRVGFLPLKIDLRPNMMPIRNQANEGSCVSFAATAVKESTESEKVWLSPRFMAERIQTNYDSGAVPRDAMGVLLNTGVCPEICQPYIARTSTSPCDKSLEYAAPNKIRAYARINTILEMRRTLYEKGPFIISFGVTKDWYHPVDGQIIIDPENPVIGGHALCIVGYDDIQRILIIRNSWGTDWGDNGYGYMIYCDVERTMWDAWSVVDIPEAEEEKPKPTPKRDLLKRILDWIITWFGWKTK